MRRSNAFVVDDAHDKVAGQLTVTNFANKWLMSVVNSKPQQAGDSGIQTA